MEDRKIDPKAAPALLGIQPIPAVLNMPRMGGGELIHWLLQENPRARVLVMSGSPGETQLPEEVVFLQKPFRFEAFNARLGELLAVPA